EAASIEAGIAKSERAVRNGQAFDTWLDVVEEQGGDRSVLTGDTAPPEAEFRFDIEAERGGSILSMDAYQIGMASLELGAGRKRKEDPVDPAAGVILQKKCGDSVDPGETIAVGYTNNNRAIEIGRELLSRAVRIGAPDGAGPSPQGLIIYKVDKKGIEELKT
ncbi:MAG: hypothetical protein R3350_07105, partial [Saprospiraceae bacterium]|nr:hypothetical protein [Saprospiraceae bacterium]